MAVDLSSIVTFITSETVMLAVLAFIAGMAGVISYHRLGSLLRKSQYKSDDAVTEAIVSEYSRRLRDYDRVIAELRTKLDIMELRAEPPNVTVTSQELQPSHPPQPHVARITSPPVITQHAPPPAVDRQEGQNGTTDYILKMLLERPRTSREVQQAIGRTREHTARLMKKLTDSQLVSRNTAVKPFQYNLTDLGRDRLREKTEAATELPTP
jgi:CRP-like cAMP-binding protein